MVVANSCSECGVATVSDAQLFCKNCGAILRGFSLLDTSDNQALLTEKLAVDVMGSGFTQQRNIVNRLWEPLLTSDPGAVGSYGLKGRLGAGGFGVVYVAEDVFGVEVAIKVLRPELSDARALRARLAREGEALRRVSSDWTARVIDVVTEGALAYIVMELVDGETLDKRIATGGPLQEPQLENTAQGLIAALRDIHLANIVHRDLKPSNIMCSPTGIKVLDFGISFIAEETSLTQTGAFIGSAAWVSPEQIRGQAITEATDVFNFGLVLAYAATGVHPYGEGRSDTLMYRISNAEPNLKEIDLPLRRVIERCLQREPGRRVSVAELSEFFEVDDTGPVSGVIGDQETLGKKRFRKGLRPAEQRGNRNRKVAAAVALIMICAAVSVVLLEKFVSKQSAENVAITNQVPATLENRVLPSSEIKKYQSCDAEELESKAQTDRSNSQYTEVVFRANYASTFLFENLRYEGNNPIMRFEGSDSDSSEPTAEEVAGRWRALIANTAGMFVLHDDLYSQQDHPYKHGPACALMMPFDYVSSALTLGAVPMAVPPIEDDIAWQEKSDDPKKVFGSFPVSEILHDYATQSSKLQSSEQTLAARSTIRSLGLLADELVKVNQNEGKNATIARGAELIARSDNAYFGSVRAKVIPIMSTKLLEGDVYAEVVESIARRRLEDGDIALTYKLANPYDISEQAQRAAAVLTLSNVIGPDLPGALESGIIWLWVSSRSDDDDLEDLAVFNAELNDARLDLSRLKLVWKPSSIFGGKNPFGEFETELKRYEQFDLSLSVNEPVESKWVQNLKG